MMPNIQIVPIPILRDNYVWVIIDGINRTAILFDPGEAAPIEAFLEEHRLRLFAILITHHHWDHVNGLLALKSKYAVPVFGPANDAVDGVTSYLKEGDQVTIEEFPITFRVLDIPCHTRGHIAYVGAGGVFCGDTLFSAGCGRLFEGTAEQMFNSLAKLAALPDDTKVYCAHEYTLNNLRFAETVEPGNSAIADYREQVKKLLDTTNVSLPSNIKTEKAVNPFLRCTSLKVRKSAEKHVGHALDNAVDVFQVLRDWKDKF